MTRLLAWLAGTLLLLVLAAGGLFLAALESQPLVKRSETLSPLSIAQARGLLLRNDPRRLRPGQAGRMAIPAALIDDGINYAASRFLHGRGALVLHARSAEIRLTLRAPLAGERFINLSATLLEAEGEPRISAAKIGPLSLPPFLVEMALGAGIRLAGYEREWQLARRAIRDLRFAPQHGVVLVAYVWEPALLEHARSLALNRDDLARLRSAHEMLAGQLDHRAAGSRVELSTVLATLLDVNGSDQLENRRAAIFVLAAYLSEKNLASILPEAANWPRARPVRLTLLGRIDSAQHFVISAALAAWAGEPLADAIGLYKELSDSRHGSGFSFADLAADRAGTIFGELLIKHPARVDELLHSPFADAALTPALADFPGPMNERDFQQRFGSPGSPAYQQVLDEIDRRIFALPLYRGLEKP